MPVRRRRHNRFVSFNPPGSRRGAFCEVELFLRAVQRQPEPGLPSTPGIEIPSPGDTFREVQERIEGWLTAGAKSVWLVSPDRRWVMVYARPHRPQVFEAGDALTDRAIPGFAVRVAELFTEG